MHAKKGMMTNKPVTANQVRSINRYKNIEHKALKCKANIHFNKKCLDDNLTPKFADIKIKTMPLASKFTQQKVGRIRLKGVLKHYCKHNRVLCIVLMPDDGR
jgi:hypothetical protein